MAYTFAQAKKAFQEDRIQELANDPSGIRFLKLRTLSLPEYLKKLEVDAGFTSSNLKGDDLLCFIFESPITDRQIETTIEAIYFNSREERLRIEDELVSELYKLDAFGWGGLHQSNLEKTIVDNYVKKIKSYEQISECIEGEIHYSLKSYVLSSWYIHWTNMIIEDIFCDHEVVSPAVGKIKKIDFFIADKPFDLKVTHLPEDFIKDIRKNERLRPEITILKGFCKKQGVHFDKHLSETRLLVDLWKKVTDHPSEEAHSIISELKQKRMAILSQCQDSKEHLIRWLYENQGERRFDASNRLFLILVDSDNFFDSWKLKRAKPLLSERIHSYLDRMRTDPGIEIDFTWKDTSHTCVSDVIFVIKP